MKNITTIPYTLFILTCLVLLPQVKAATAANNFDSENYIQLQTASSISFSAYVVGPRQADKGILLIHGWWGLTQDVETWANQFAVKGYRVMAIDLYNRQTTKLPAQAKKLMNFVKQSDANEKYLAAINALSAPGRKIAVLGRSFGGYQALYAASVGQEKLSAAIIYYPFGDVMTVKPVLSSIKVPVLGHFAREDFFMTPDKFNAFKSTMKKAGVNMTFQAYQARHGFDKANASNYQGKASQLAMKRTYQFLSQYLN